MQILNKNDKKSFIIQGYSGIETIKPSSIVDVPADLAYKLATEYPRDIKVMEAPKPKVEEVSSEGVEMSEADEKKFLLKKAKRLGIKISKRAKAETIKARIKKAKK